MPRINQAVPEIQHFNEDGNVQAEVAHSNYDCNSDSDSDVQSEFNENSDSESLEHAMDELELTSFFWHYFSTQNVSASSKMPADYYADNQRRKPSNFKTIKTSRWLLCW